MVPRVALHGCVVPVHASRPPAASSNPHVLECGARARAGQRPPRSVAHVLTAGGPADLPWAVHMGCPGTLPEQDHSGGPGGPGTALPSPGAPPCSLWKKPRSSREESGRVPWGGNHSASLGTRIPVSPEPHCAADSSWRTGTVPNSSDTPASQLLPQRSPAPGWWLSQSTPRTEGTWARKGPAPPPEAHFSV